MTNKFMYFVANWKMFGDLKGLNSLNDVIKFAMKNKKKNFKVIYCPPSTLIFPLFKKFKNTPIDLGGQNSHESENYGPYTGSINSKMLMDVGAKYLILGHSENRQSGENDRLINLKIKSALKIGLKIIFCIGETLKEKQNNKTNQILSNQIKIGLNGIKNKSKIIIAYEPVWSIGSGLIPKLSDLNSLILFIKKKFKNKSQKILYGGSVNENNINQLKTINSVDGFLVGAASQDAKKFIDIIKKTYN